MTIQRKRGLKAKVFVSKRMTDSRGNVQIVADENHPVTVPAWIQPQRSSKAEVPGQQKINVIELGFSVTPDLADLDLWSRVEWRGAIYDLVTPPSYHHGTRHTRHYTAQLRERP